MGDVYPELQGETMFSSSSNNEPTFMREFVILADKILLAFNKQSRQSRRFYLWELILVVIHPYQS